MTDEEHQHLMMKGRECFLDRLRGLKPVLIRDAKTVGHGQKA